MKQSMFFYYCLIFLFSFCGITVTVSGTPMNKVAINVELEAAPFVEEVLNNAYNNKLISFADFYTASGSHLEFYTADQNGLESSLLIEQKECDHCPSALESYEALTCIAAKPLAVFWAITERGTEVPELLEATAEVCAKDIGLRQGWARKELMDLPIETARVEATLPPKVACGNNSFQSSIACGFLGTPEYVRLDKKPNNYNSFKSDCYAPGNGQCWGEPRYKLEAKWNQIKKWRGKICCKAVENAYNSHWVSWCGTSCSVDPNCNKPQNCRIYVGPTLFFQYYWNGEWKTMKNNGKTASYEIDANKTKMYNWCWETSKKTSFRLYIRYAKPYDEFDLMMDM